MHTARRTTGIVIVVVLVAGLTLTAGTMAMVGSHHTPGAKRQAQPPAPVVRGRSPHASASYPVATARPGWQSRLSIDPSLSADNASTATVLDAAASKPKYVAIARTLQSMTQPPPPQASASFPPIPASRRDLSAGAYVRSWARELLDVNFASDSRRQLLAWANLNVAAVPLLPIPVQDAPLYAIDQLRSSPSPVPSAAMWKQLAAEHVTWQVSDVLTRDRSVWQTTITDGLVPPDPRMEMLVVTGTLTVTQPGKPTRTEQISLDATTATGLYETGYGIAEADHWTVAG